MNTILTIDIAHPPFDGAEAEAVLNDALKKIHLSAKLRVLKIIHGYGSTGKGGVLKTVVKDWAYANRKRIKCVIDGEGISTFDLDVLELAAECDLSVKDDLGVANEGTTIVWIK